MIYKTRTEALQNPCKTLRTQSPYTPVLCARFLRALTPRKDRANCYSFGAKPDYPASVKDSMIVP